MTDLTAIKARAETFKDSDPWSEADRDAREYVHILLALVESQQARIEELEKALKLFEWVDSPTWPLVMDFAKRTEAILSKYRDSKMDPQELVGMAASGLAKAILEGPTPSPESEKGVRG